MIVLETEAAFPYCNWSTKVAWIFWFGSTSVELGPAYVNNWQMLGRLPFQVYLKVVNYLKQKSIIFLASKIKIFASNFFEIK